MRTILTTGDINDLIHEQHHPDNFSSKTGVTEHKIDCAYRGTKVFSKLFHLEGILIQYGRYLFEDPLTIVSNADQPVLEMHFNLNGFYRGSVSGLKNPLVFQEGEHTISYVPEPKGRFEYSQNTLLEGVEISFTQAYFQRFQDQNCQIIDQLLEAVEKQNAFFNPHPGAIDPLMRNTIHEMIHNPYEGSVRRIYMESKVLELFAMQLAHFEKRKDRRVDPSHDKEKLNHAKVLLEKRLNNPPTIYELSRLVGLNEFKLKKGFKELFGNSIFQYATDYRLDFARQFVLDTDKSIAEISEIIGYSQPQHFATAFKRKYGVAPSELRNR